MTRSSVPAANKLDRPSGAGHRSWSVFPLVCFLVGSVSGLLLGSTVDLGVASTIHKTTVAPIRAVIFFAGFSVCCYLSTWLWRLARRYLVGRYHATAIAALVSGFSWLRILPDRRVARICWAAESHWLAVSSAVLRCGCHRHTLRSCGRRSRGCSQQVYFRQRPACPGDSKYKSDR